MKAISLMVFFCLILFNIEGYSSPKVHYFGDRCMPNIVAAIEAFYMTQFPGSNIDDLYIESVTLISKLESIPPVYKHRLQLGSEITMADGKKKFINFYEADGQISISSRTDTEALLALPLQATEEERCSKTSYAVTH